MDIRNIDIKLVFGYGNKWFSEQGIFVKGFAFENNNILREEKDLINYFNKIDSFKDFENRIKLLNGQFSVIYYKNEQLYIAVDPCRNFPIFYKVGNEDVAISDSTEVLINDNFKFSESAKEEFLEAGFVTNKFTLCEGVYQVQAGSIVHLENGKLQEKFYHHFAEGFSFSTIFKKNLEEIFDRISQRLFNLLNGRTAIVSLSGGYDSRLIACMLKKLAYKNVICYSYGIRSSEDVKISEITAKKLGFKWIFVPCDEDTMKGFPDSERFEEYYSYASNYVSGFFTQDYFAVKYLNKSKVIPHNSVFIAGHSGDMLSGSHLFKGINKGNLSELLYKKHYTGNHTFSKFKTRIELGIHNLKAFENFDNWNLKERQAKFIINSCRVYEYFGYTYHLPLWDKELVSFFGNAKFEERLNQKIYIETIFEYYFKPMNIAFKKVSFHENAIRFLLTGIFRRLKRVLYTDDLNCKLSAKKLLKHTPLNMHWDGAKININAIISAWYIGQIENKHR